MTHHYKVLIKGTALSQVCARQQQRQVCEDAILVCLTANAPLVCSTFLPTRR